MIGTQRDAVGSLKKDREHDPRLQAGEGSTYAVVNITPERHVPARPTEDDVMFGCAAEEAFETTPTLGGAQPVQCLGLDLPDALTRDREPLADLFEGAVGFLTDPKAHPQDLLLARGQRRVF
jgi:hypothetical protein